MSEFHSELRKEFADPDYRAAYVDSFIDAWVALQIRVIREQRGMTQKELADALHTTQTAISRLENANYAGRSISTLKSVAKALDCRLKVSFETYGSLIGEAEKFSSDFLRRPSFKDEFGDSVPTLANLPKDMLATSGNNEKLPAHANIEGIAAEPGNNLVQFPPRGVYAELSRKAV